MAEKGLLAIFGPPKKDGVKMGMSEDSDDYDSDIPADFRDHCDAAFDALKDKDSKAFCQEMWLAIKAYEEQPHEEAEEPEDELEDEE